MKNEEILKINKLAVLYKSNCSEDSFKQIYSCLDDIRRQNKVLILKSGLGDESEALEIFHDVLLRTLHYNPEDFVRWLNKSLKNARIDFIRRKRRWQVMISPQEVHTDEDESIETLPFISDFNLEEFVVRKTEADQLQLIDSLISDPSKVDPVTTLIVTEFSKHKSITALAKALGLHHEVVKRKLRALSRYYDANRFGDYRDYLSA